MSTKARELLVSAGAWDIATHPRKFKEAIDAFRKKVIVTSGEWDKLDAKAKQKAFRVAGVAQLDLVSDVWTAIDRAIRDGTTLEDFKRAIGDRVRRAWGGSVDAPGHRLDTIFRTNVQSAYSAGRWAQLTDDDVMESHPVWTFDAVLDDATTDVCEDCDGTTLDAGASWWDSHNPPLHFSCRSGIIPMTVEDAKGAMTSKAPTVQAADGFGLSPDDEDWEPSRHDYPAALWNEKEIA